MDENRTTARVTAAAAQKAARQATPELRTWIVAQAQAGFTAEQVLQSMRASGWDEDVAIAAMESTLQAHLTGQGQPAANTPDATAVPADALPDALPDAVPVPEPDLAQSPLYIDAGDRRVHVLQRVADPRIVVFGNLLSDEECDALVAAAEPRMARSRTVEIKTGGDQLNDDRTSDGMFFTRGESELIARIEQRIATLLRWPLENGEGLQVLHYGPRAEYKPHYDYFDPQEPGTPTILKRGGQRVGTLIVYLSEPDQGGGTTFPDVQMEVAPKRGNAVFFSYPRAHPSTRTLHGGAPVIAGEKWIATKWLREREFT